MKLQTYIGSHKLGFHKPLVATFHDCPVENYFDARVFILWDHVGGSQWFELSGEDEHQSVRKRPQFVTESGFVDWMMQRVHHVLWSKMDSLNKETNFDWKQICEPNTFKFEEIDYQKFISEVSRLITFGEHKSDEVIKRLIDSLEEPADREKLFVHLSLVRSLKLNFKPGLGAT